SSIAARSAALLSPPDGGLLSPLDGGLRGLRPRSCWRDWASASPAARTNTSTRIMLRRTMRAAPRRLWPGAVGDAEAAGDDVVARLVDARAHRVGDQARVVLVEGEALAFLGEAERAAAWPPLTAARQGEGRFDRDVDMLDQRGEDRAGIERVLVAV